MAKGAWVCKMATASSTAARVAAQELSDGGDTTSSSSLSTFRSRRRRLAKEGAEKKLLAAFVRVEALEKENEALRARVEVLSNVSGEHETIPRHDLGSFVESQVFADCGNRKVSSEDEVSSSPASTAPEPIGIGVDDEDVTSVATTSDAWIESIVEHEIGPNVLKFDLCAGDFADVAVQVGDAAYVNEQTQTDIGFDRHDETCVIARGAGETAEFGLVWLARQHIEKMRMCNEAVNDLLNAEQTPPSGDMVAESIEFEGGGGLVTCESKPCQATLIVKRALSRFRQAVQTAEAKVGYGEDMLTVSKKALKMRVKRKRKRIDIIAGADIVEARANVKAIPVEELLGLEELFHLEDRGHMKASRRRRRLAWVIWLHADPERSAQGGPDGAEAH